MTRHLPERTPLWLQSLIFVTLENLSKTTKYENVLDKICPSAHYLANTEFGVIGGRSTCLPVTDSCLSVYEY
jgi:hypothetical protein